MFDFLIHKILRRPYRARVRYDRRPSNATQTIIFIHGIASSYSSWSQTVQQIAKDPAFKTVRLVGIDLVGFGKNRKADYFSYDFRDYTKSLHHTIKKLRIKTPIIFAGHSMGCLISANFTSVHPNNVKALVLVSPPYLKPADIRKLPDNFYMSTYTSLKDHTDDPAINAIANFVSRLSSFDSRSLKTRAFKECMENIILNNENWSTIKSISLPIYLVHGRLDPLVYGGNLKTLSRDRDITLVESIGGHDITGAKRTRVINVIKRAISDDQA